LKTHDKFIALISFGWCGRW